MMVSIWSDKSDTWTSSKVSHGTFSGIVVGGAIWRHGDDDQSRPTMEERNAAVMIVAGK